jgi:hypothetical protein
MNSHVNYVAYLRHDTSKCFLEISWHDYWLIVVSRTHILIITDLNTKRGIKCTYEHEITYNIKIYEYLISNPVCMK